MKDAPIVNYYVKRWGMNVLAAREIECQWLAGSTLSALWGARGFIFVVEEVLEFGASAGQHSTAVELRNIKGCFERG